MTYPNALKRTLDVLLSGVALVVLSPLMLLVAGLIKAFDPGPALFRQERTGQFGHPFILMKYRSMPVNTGDIPSGELGAVRMTWVGRFIRRSNLDELPQLINIFKGDMSLVGPRPSLPKQENLNILRRSNGALALKPGLTGWAQVNAFNGMSEERKAELDGIYASSVSFIKDMEIILRTVKYLLSPPPKY